MMTMMIMTMTMTTMMMMMMTSITISLLTELDDDDAISTVSVLLIIVIILILPIIYSHYCIIPKVNVQYPLLNAIAYIDLRGQGCTYYTKSVKGHTVKCTNT